LVDGCGDEYDEQLLDCISVVFKPGLSAGSRHTSNDSARLMKLCGVMELC
jgi:hypothetical protein